MLVCGLFRLDREEGTKLNLGSLCVLTLHPLVILAATDVCTHVCPNVSLRVRSPQRDKTFNNFYQNRFFRVEVDARCLAYYMSDDKPFPLGNVNVVLLLSPFFRSSSWVGRQTGCWTFSRVVMHGVCECVDARSLSGSWAVHSHTFVSSRAFRVVILFFSRHGVAAFPLQMQCCWSKQTNKRASPPQV